MKSHFSAVIGLALLATAQFSNAAPTTLTFDTAATGASYTEAGMTITATSAEPVRTGGGTWFLDCCDNGPETFSFSTGGIFNFLSIFRGHVDGSDPIFWKGFRNGIEVASNSYNSGQGSDFLFTGFSDLDLVTMSVSGTWTDPNFDNLTYESQRSNVPEPASLLLLGMGLAGLGLSRRKKI